MRTKIVIDNNILEQVSHLNYIGCNIFYGYDEDLQTKINWFGQICGMNNRNMKHKTRKDMQQIL